MSDDLIKKEEAREAVCKGCLKDWKICHHHWDCPMLTNLEKLPSVNRPQGEWIRISDDWIDGTCGARYFPIRCSVCGYSTYDDGATKYCPNCGADMREREGE